MNDQFAFMVTSAINTKFGIFDSVQRLNQTIETVESIKARSPGSKIILLEMSAIPLTDEQRGKLISLADNFIDFTSDKSVIELFNSTDNWDVVKNVTEVLCFLQALVKLKDTNALQGIERVFKISGRYTLNDDFDIEYYKSYSVKTHIVIKEAKKSQFAYNLIKAEKQFMSRLWSWPTVLIDDIISVYQQTLFLMQQRILDGGYIDIEHSLYELLDHEKVIQKEIMGVEGNLGPTARKVND